MKPISLREAYVQASSFLEASGIGQDLDRTLKWLLEYVTGLNQSELLLQWHEPFPPEKIELWHECLQRKAKGEPVQYIIGEQEFYGLSFHVNPDVLIPRPETELLVEQVLKLAEGPYKDLSPIIADIGTGSGAIPVTLAAKLPHWEQIIATDISSKALQTARENAAKHGVSGRIQFIHGDLLTPLLGQGKPRIDLLISNPPYIPSSELNELHKEVKDYEPLLALDGGESGITIYQRLAHQIEMLSQPPAWVGLEVGIGQAQSVAALLEELKLWDKVYIIKDLANIERHVIATMID